MKDKNILIIPHTPHVHVKVRSFEMARALSTENNVYYLLWDEVDDFTLLGRVKQQVAGLTIGRRKRPPSRPYTIRKQDDVTVLENVRRAYSPIWYAQKHNSQQIDRIIDEYKIDIVINASFVSSPVRKRDSLIYIYDIVDDPFDSGSGNMDRIRSRFIEREIAKADIVTACSLTLAEYATRTWRKRVQYLPNGTDVSSFEAVLETEVEALRKRWVIEGKKVIGFISNFEPWNGLAFLARVFRRLCEKRTDTVLMLVGSGKGLDQARSEYGSMSNVILTGAIPPDKVAAYFKMIDVGVLPFDQCNLTDRALPIKIIEYSAAKKHVVAVPLVELRRQKFPNVHLADRNVDLWADAVDAAIGMSWNDEWDNRIIQYDWARIIEDKLVPYVQKATRLSRNVANDEVPSRRKVLSYSQSK